MISRAGQAALAAATVLAAGGCAADPRPAPSGPPVANGRITLTAPAGAAVARCWFADEPGARLGRLVAFLVPADFERLRDPGFCTWIDPEHQWRHVASVQVDDETLAAFKAEALDPYEAQGGDDAVTNIELREPATIFDGRTCALLEADVYSDGEQHHVVLGQVGDVRLRYSVPTEGFPDTTYDDAPARASLSGLQIVEGVRRPAGVPQVKSD